MKLNNSFWRHFELDLQEIKLAYLNWAIGYARGPKPEHRHLFLWDHQEDFCIINSRYGRSFSISPFGIGVRGVPRIKLKGIPRGMDEIDIALKARLTENTRCIRAAIASALETGNLDNARQMVLNFFWLKLGAHELLFDRMQLEYGERGKVRKGRWGLDESEGSHTLTGLRNRIVNTVRFGETLENEYIQNLNKKLPGFSKGTLSTFLSSALSWNRYGLCAFDCGPVIWSKRGVVHFNQVKQRMNQIGWPYHGSPSQVLRPLYKIALNYRRPPIRLRCDPDEGYSWKSLRRRACQIYEIIDNILNEINRIRKEEIG
ncbi:hypothetical protein [uncultured Desulfosarcina sp.]|uniref:hypothetical protein n=1 Tax=uncultured Desulfosarcina sp. TaxID=218289 RepID=UPI0029C67A65|nr:hypothetical protein [uncultured Desulfosarcina sp.]